MVSQPTKKRERKFLIISSIEFVEYLEFLPGGKHFELLKQLLDLYLNDGLEYDVKFIVTIKNIKELRWNDKRLKLGQSMWLGKPKKDVVEFNYSYEKFAQAASRK